MGLFNFQGLIVEKAPDSVLPRCPSCGEDLKRLWIKSKGTGIVEQQVVVMCPHCRVMLGYGINTFG